MNIKEFLEEHIESNMEDLEQRLGALAVAAQTARDRINSGEEISLTKVMEDVHLKYSEMCSPDWTLDTLLHLDSACK